MPKYLLSFLPLLLLPLFANNLQTTHKVPALEVTETGGKSFVSIEWQPVVEQLYEIHTEMKRWEKPKAKDKEVRHCLFFKPLWLFNTFTERCCKEANWGSAGAKNKLCWISCVEWVYEQFWRDHSCSYETETNWGAIANRQGFTEAWCALCK